MFIKNHFRNDYHKVKITTISVGEGVGCDWEEYQWLYSGRLAMFYFLTLVLVTCVCFHKGLPWNGTTDWFQIGKGVRQSCILSPCLSNLYAEYIMRNAGLEETQAAIKIAGRNINNLTVTLHFYNYIPNFNIFLIIPYLFPSWVSLLYIFQG